MCIDPISLSGIAGLAQVVGVGASVAGTLIGAQAQANANQAAADQNNRNAIIAQRNAEDARERGNAATQDQQMKTRARIGMQKNALSERNIAVNSGSALDILGDTAMFGKIDALTTSANFEREAIGYETQQMNFNAQAEVDRMAARNAGLAGGVSAFSTALTGVGNLAVNNKRRISL